MGRNEIVAGTVSPSYLSPLQGLQRLEKIMDDYVGGIGTYYATNEPMLNRGLELLTMLKEDLDHIGAEDLHQLQRAWELNHRVWTAESVTRHPVQAGNQVAGLLLSCGLSKARRRRVACLYRITIRSADG